MSRFPCPLCGSAVLQLPGHEILLDSIYCNSVELEQLVEEGIFDWTHSLCLKNSSIGRLWSRAVADSLMSDVLYRDDSSFVVVNAELQEVYSWYDGGYFVVWNLSELQSASKSRGGILLPRHSPISVEIPDGSSFVIECERDLRSDGLPLSRLLSFLGIDGLYGHLSPIGTSKVIPLPMASDETFNGLNEGFLDGLAKYEIWIPDSHVALVGQFICP